MEKTYEVLYWLDELGDEIQYKIDVSLYQYKGVIESDEEVGFNDLKKMLGLICKNK